MLDRARPRSEEIFRRLEALRSRSSLVDEPRSFPWKLFGFLRRTLVRIRDLGAARDLQSELFRELIDQQIAVTAELAETRQLIDELRAAQYHLSRRITDAETRNVQVQQRVEELQGSIEIFDQRLLDSNEQLRGQYAAQYATLHEGMVELRNVGGALRQEDESLRARQYRLEKDLAALNERIRTPQASAKQELPSPADFRELLRTIEEDLRAPAEAVEVSIQSARAEDLMLIAIAHFGQRMSSSAAPYRSPNDLWIHVDFTPRRDRRILLENAAARLRSGGKFIVVTSEGASTLRRDENLTLIWNRQIRMASGAVVTAFAWERA